MPARNTNMTSLGTGKGLCAGQTPRGLYEIQNGMIVVNVSRMRHQISIVQYQAASPPVYNSGGLQPTYSTIAADVPAAIEMIRGTDVIKGGLQTTELYLQIMVWFNPSLALLPSMRVMQQHNGSQYVIQSVENIEGLDVILY